ncbi:hypothetical protein FSP39_005757 [Pinctada imbricata]|uniref:Exonuclease domain-containing protein n=1 Tax=Pinctada imbricata TaxID=66713 RepID=A0AA88YME6_PINIB|nr:hypothetical protein FSP39_005757 [Pinctada imbricata]
MSTMSTRPRSKKGRFRSKKQQSKVDLFIKNNVDREKTTRGDDCSEESANDDNSEHITWRDGRRVVEFGVLIDELKAGCRFCDQPISLVDLTSELRYGLGSLLSVKCKNDHINLIPTGKRHFRAKSDSLKAREQAWEINDKLAFGIDHSGVGFKKSSELFSILNIPFPSHTTLKRCERAVGKVIEGVAKESCRDAAISEKERTDESSQKVTASFDAGWQKRGSGKSYSSLSGHAALIGKETGKVISYATRNKFCRKCDFAERNNISADDHDCRKNWTGSSKAMEPDMCVSMVTNLHKDEISVGCLEMDNDATTIAKVRSEVDPSMKKTSDKNHTMKQFANRLWDLKKQKHYKELSAKTITHIKKCFSFCLAQNSGDVSAIQSELPAIVPHLYGVHDKCSIQWCGYLKAPDTYVPKRLPYKRYLRDVHLKSDLSSILQEFAQNSEMLAHLGSSQSNESLNNTIASKAPKANFFSGSESNDYRVAAAVAQKNLGYQYISKVNERMLLSPGKVTQTMAEKTDRKRERAREVSRTVEAKRRRIQKKVDKLSEEACCETREGTTYESGVDLNNNSPDTIEIPSNVMTPTFQKVPDGKYSFVYFDLETTGLRNDSHITQIGAIVGDEKFERFVLPKKKVETGAVAVTGLSSSGTLLFKNGEPVDARGIKDSLSDFSTWIKKFPDPVLVAHNAKFDAEILCNTLIRISDVDSNFIVGFVDTLSLLREKIPGRSSYKQEELAKDLLQQQYSAHDAPSDAAALQDIVQCVCSNSDGFLKHSFSVQSVINTIQFEHMKSSNISSLYILFQKNVISKMILNKIAASGLNISHLQIAHRRDPENGIRNLLLEKVSSTGQPRVTANSRIISSISHHFQLSCS